MLFRPFESSRRIADSYRRYLLTTFSTNNETYNRQLRQLLQADKAVADGPYISMTDPYEKGASLETLAAEGVVSAEILKLGKLYPRRRLYRHQEEAVRKAVAGKNLIVTTGTGSGKTESFLIPVINQLLREKEAGTLGPGVRTLIIYPMNALVNDQIRRLRELLSVMEEEPKITFGRFTGETAETYKEAKADYDETEEEPLCSNELICREQMRESPPNILITNYAMLEYMLLRPGDNIIFGGDYAPKWQYIVFDEAHSYTGAKGIEVASLVRRVKAMLGRPDLRFILTSATLGDENSNREILRFGSTLCDAEFTDSSIIRSYIKKIEPTRDVGDLDYDIYRKLAEQIRLNAPDDVLLKIMRSFGISPASGAALPEILLDMVLHDRFYYRVRSALNGQIKTVSAVAAELGLEEESFTDFITVASSAVRDGERLFEAKYHMFLRGMEGVFITLNPSNKLFIHRMETYREQPDENDIGYRVFEVSFCNNCNTLFITGEYKTGYLIQKSKFSDNYSPAVFMMCNDYDGDPSENDDLYQICAKCGAIKRASSQNGLQCGHGQENINYLVRVKENNEPLHKCPSCNNTNTHRSILRPYYLGNEAATAVIATALYAELPGEIHRITYEEVDVPFLGKQRIPREEFETLDKQFLAFSDNRQNAAFFASYLEDTYRVSIIKRIMHQVMDENKEKLAEGMSLEDFARKLLRRFEAENVFAGEDKPSHDQIEHQTWICILNELSDFKAKNSLLKKGGLCFEADLRIQAIPPLLSEKELGDLALALIRHMMNDCAVDTGIEFTEAEEAQIGPAGMLKGYNETAGGSNIEAWMPEEGRSNKRLKYVTKILGDEDTARKVMQYIWFCMRQDALLKPVHIHKTMAWRLDAGRIRVRTARQLYRCPECGMVTPYNVRGICEKPRCSGTLQPFDPRLAAEDDHYNYLYTHLDPVPMRVQEHTAQLSSKKAYQYQKQFKKKRINVLSCSTTFEMGVDVGTLETVFMRNMPPSPANYAQRAGRAGRSLNAAAYAITFCPNNSHDLNYFHNPVAMIRGTINPPFINISNDKIVQRHIYASAFSFFWRAYPELYKKLICDFMEADGFGKMRTYLESKPGDLRDYLKQVVPGDLQEMFGIDSFAWVPTLFNDSEEQRGLCDVVVSQYTEDIRDLDNIRNKLFAQKSKSDHITHSINTIKHQRIIEFLSRNNLIPKYGFPVDTVELKGVSHRTGSDLRLSRDLFTAISEYAPGSEIVANGKLLTSRYVRKLSGYDWPTYHYAVCPDCQTLNRKLAALGSVSVCRQCSRPLGGRNRSYVIPKFGFQLDNHGVQKVGSNKPERTYKGSISYIGDVSQLHYDSYSVCGKTVMVGSSKMDRLAVLNESPFFLCNTCGYGVVDEKTTDLVKKQAHTNPSGYACANKTLRKYSLGHELQTDVAILKFADFDISQVEKAWTILYSLLEGLSRCMNIDRNELSGCLQWYRDDSHPDGNFGFVLFDNTPGGAGYVRQLVDADVLADMLKTGYAVVRECACGGSVGDTACYSCLCNYYNQRQHDILQRRYALEFYQQLLEGSGGVWSCVSLESDESAETVQPQPEPESSAYHAHFCRGGRNMAGDTAREIWEELLEDCEESEEAQIEAIARLSPVRIAAPFYHADLQIPETGEKIFADLAWKDRKVMLFLEENQEDYEKACQTDWHCFCTAKGFRAEELLKYIEV